MSGFIGFLIAIAMLSIPVLLVILVIRLLMKKSVKTIAIVVVACAWSIIPLTVVGGLIEPTAISIHREDDVHKTEDSSDTGNEETLDEITIDDYVVETSSLVDEEETETESVVIEEATTEHEHGKIFSFQPKGSTAMSDVRPYCEKWGHSYLGYSLFRGTPEDLSYLGVICEHSDSDEIVWGEYYTITATVSLADYDFQRTRIRCEVQSGNIIVNFSVEFREGFEELVDAYDEGDEITFRGRFYDEGCGFSDCELITE